MAIRRANDPLARSRARRRPSNRSTARKTERTREWYTIDEHGRPQSGCVLSSDDDSTSDWDSSAPLSVLPRARRPVRPNRVASQTAPLPFTDELSSVDDWVRNLIELRRWRQLPQTTALTSATREWISEQHRALENASLPILLKCVLTVCNASPTFHDCRKDFLRPEYRNRYWSWCLTFIRLIDYHLDYGHVKVHLRGGQRYKPLMLFIQNAQTQKEEGSLPDLKEQLLSAVGVQWDRTEQVSPFDMQAEVDPSDDFHLEGNEIEWDMVPAAVGTSRKMKMDSLSQRTKKRRRLGSAHATYPSPNSKPHSSMFDSGYYAGMTGAQNGRRSILDWARHIVALRAYFREGKGYEIPPDHTNLTIWMLSEKARSVAGTLPAICCCVLRVTKVTDAVDDTVYISEECESWCMCYVEFLDFALKADKPGYANRKPPTSVTDFMFDCRQNVIECTLSEERSALLRAVDEHWLESKLMDLSIRRNRAKLGVRQLKRVEDANSFASVEEIELDSGTYQDLLRYEPRRRPVAPKKAKSVNTGKQCKAMISAMIKGVIGETIEGRKRTAAEKEAEEWVSESGTQALNNYARLWFRDATMNLRSRP
ncbi:hypothetical protein FGB62_198g014 [Gracilaria domingensis]|nr:hypothetical protein FGB62_198g014 [Gracilaria domingensis]